MTTPLTQTLVCFAAALAVGMSLFAALDSAQAGGGKKGPGTSADTSTVGGATSTARTAYSKNPAAVPLNKRHGTSCPTWMCGANGPELTGLRLETLQQPRFSAVRLPSGESVELR